MNTEDLINSVEIRRPLWDQQDPTHHNRYVLDKLWDEIAKEMKCERNSVRAKWKALRDKYRQLLLGENSRSGDAGRRPPSWPFFSRLAFLKDTLLPRDMHSNLQSTSDPTVLGTQDELLSTPRNNSPTISMTRDTDTDSVGDDFQRPSTSGSSCTSGTGSLPNRVSTTSVRRKRQGDWGREILQVERQKLALIEAQQQKQSQFMEEKDEDNMYFFKSLLPLVQKTITSKK